MKEAGFNNPGGNVLAALALNDVVPLRVLRKHRKNQPHVFRCPLTRNPFRLKLRTHGNDVAFVATISKHEMQRNPSEKARADGDRLDLGCSEAFGRHAFDSLGVLAVSEAFDMFLSLNSERLRLRPLPLKGRQRMPPSDHSPTGEAPEHGQSMPWLFEFQIVT